MLGLPRGGVPVAAEVARALGAPLDVFMVAKIGLPGRVELAVGASARAACASSTSGSSAPRGSAPRRSTRWPRGPGRSCPSASGATGATGRRSSSPAGWPSSSTTVWPPGDDAGRGHRPARARDGRVAVAVPVAPASTRAELARLVDEIVCVAIPEPFVAISAWYEDFPPTDDAEFLRLMSAPDRRLVGGGQAGAPLRPPTGQLSPAATRSPRSEDSRGTARARRGARRPRRRGGAPRRPRPRRRPTPGRRRARPGAPASPARRTPPSRCRAHGQDDPVLRRRLVRAGGHDEPGAPDPVGLELLDYDTVEKRSKLASDDLSPGCGSSANDTPGGRPAGTPRYVSGLGGEEGPDGLASGVPQPRNPLTHPIIGTGIGLILGAVIGSPSAGAGWGGGAAAARRTVSPPRPSRSPVAVRGHDGHDDAAARRTRPGPAGRRDPDDHRSTAHDVDHDAGRAGAGLPAAVDTTPAPVPPPTPTTDTVSAPDRTACRGPTPTPRRRTSLDPRLAPVFSRGTGYAVQCADGSGRRRAASRGRAAGTAAPPDPGVRPGRRGLASASEATIAYGGGVARMAGIRPMQPATSIGSTRSMPRRSSSTGPGSPFFRGRVEHTLATDPRGAFVAAGPSGGSRARRRHPARRARRLSLPRSTRGSRSADSVRACSTGR